MFYYKIYKKFYKPKLIIEGYYLIFTEIFLY